MPREYSSYPLERPLLTSQVLTPCACRVSKNRARHIYLDDKIVLLEYGE